MKTKNNDGRRKMQTGPVGTANEVKGETLRAGTQMNSGVQSVSTSTAPAGSEPRGFISHGPNGEICLMPDPRDLLREAEQEPNYRDLAEYAAVIRTLREKGLTYRDISSWLSERGVEADHNAVYRVYTGTLSEDEAHDEQRRVDQEAEDDAMRGR